MASAAALAASQASPWLLYQRLYPSAAAVALPPPPPPLLAAQNSGNPLLAAAHAQSPPPPPSPFQLAIQSLIAHGQRMIAKQQEELLRNLQPLDKDKGEVEEGTCQNNVLNLQKMISCAYLSLAKDQ